MARHRNVEKEQQTQYFGCFMHIAPVAGNVWKSPENQARTTTRPPRNVRPFILPSLGC
jgi:hypothetical protein